VEVPSWVEKPVPFTITDHKNRESGDPIPEWVDTWIRSDIRDVETLQFFGDRYLFIGRKEGNSFNALSLWNEGFSVELDFPRLAAPRIRERFSGGIANPDAEYGAYYEALIRAASDYPWTGAFREDDFWIRKKIFPTEDEPESEYWEYLVLVSIDKSHFTAQLNTIFQSISPSPAPTRTQTNAINRVIDGFFDGF
jgi:hypothetical protein